MSKKWTDLKRELFVNHPVCKLCQEEPAVHLHHIIGRMKGHPELDVKENALEVCATCHTQKAHSRKGRERAWEINCERYEHMREWLEGLDLKVKPRLS